MLSSCLNLTNKSFQTHSLTSLLDLEMHIITTLDKNIAMNTLKTLLALKLEEKVFSISI